MKKIGIWIGALIILSLVIFCGYNSNILGVSANPDYICKKQVFDSPCRVTDYPATCSPWTADGTRTCPGVKTTEVSYYLVRTNCESGYTKVAKGAGSGASGRHGADYPSKTESCTIVESDHVMPTGEIN